MIKRFIIGPVMIILFNKVLNSAYFPSCGRWVIFHPYLKRVIYIGDPNNYRGITVCSCLGKFFTLIINDRLTKHLDEDNIIHNNQLASEKAHALWFFFTGPEKAI